jgi:L-lactate dehydrogenase complex protein LldE
MRVSILIPCYVDLYQPQVGFSVVQVLERLGHTVDYPLDFHCCGQPPFNGGCDRDARAVARDVLRLYQDAEVVVVPSGSCAAMVRKFYPELLKDEQDMLAQAKAMAEKTFEFSEFLRGRLHVYDVGARLKAKATFHDGCHGMRELGIHSAPRELLAHVRDLELVEMDEAATCCGFGGMFSVKFPQISTAMVEVKSAAIARTTADTLISNDPSCLLHLEGYYRQQNQPLRCLHLAEVLAKV